MKQERIGILAGMVTGILGMMALALPLFAQKDINAEEKQMLERYSRSNVLYLDGVKQFTKGNLDKAEKKLLQAMETMPGHADSYYLMAQIQLKRKEFSKALDSITAAEKNHAAIAKFQPFTLEQHLDRLRQQRRDLEAQRERIEDYFSRLPANGENRRTYKIAVDNIARNLKWIDTQLNSPIPTTFEIPADYFYIHGNVLYQLGMRGDAAAQYQEALRLNPGHGNAYNNLALAWFSLGKYQEALDCLLRADAAGVKVNPDFKRAVEAKIPPL